MKKLVTVILVLTLALSCFVGCGGNGNEFDPDASIGVVSREDGSGTRGAFVELFDGVEKNSNLTYSQICQKFENNGIEIFCENILNNLDK